MIRPTVPAILLGAVVLGGCSGGDRATAPPAATATPAMTTAVPVTTAAPPASSTVRDVKARACPSWTRDISGAWQAGYTLTDCGAVPYKARGVWIVVMTARDEVTDRVFRAAYLVRRDEVGFMTWSALNDDAAELSPLGPSDVGSEASAYAERVDIG